MCVYVLFFFNIFMFYVVVFLIPAKKIVVGGNVASICKFGDTVITQACAAIYQKKVKGVAIEKGIAFPT